MTTQYVLVEVPDGRGDAFAAFRAATLSESEALSQAERLLDPLAGLGADVVQESLPVPMFTPPRARWVDPVPDPFNDFRSFGVPNTNPDMTALTAVLSIAVDESRMTDLRALDRVLVWPSSQLSLVETEGDGRVSDGVDCGPHHTSVDCRPFREGVDVAAIQSLLGVERVWADGFTGEGITVAILDEGIDGTVYPLVGGFSRPGAPAPGSAAVTSHGSMCAAGVLVAAPNAGLADYPFLGVPRSGGAIAMFQAVLEQRRFDGTPHVTTNSYGFTGVPPSGDVPTHEIHDLNHPLHRKVREVVASGVVTFFAAGNCGVDCPSGSCDASGIGPGRSIHATNSIEEVITVAAVNARGERLGYSSQGPGMFAERKPDIAAYSHFFGNFGPGRPGGDEQPYDNGTSAAAPVAAGVGALLCSAAPQLAPRELSTLIKQTSASPRGKGWGPEYGWGIVNAAASYDFLLSDRYAR